MNRTTKLRLLARPTAPVSTAIGQLRTHIKNIITLENIKTTSGFSYSIPKADIWIGKKFYHIAALGWIVIVVIEIFYDTTGFSDIRLRFPWVSIWLVLPIFSVCSAFVYLCLFKFASKVVFDPKKGVLITSLIRRKKPIIKRIHELETVELNWHTIFRYTDGQTIWFKASPELFKFLREHNLPKSWKWFGKFFYKSEYISDSG